MQDSACIIPLQTLLCSHFKETEWEILMMYKWHDIHKPYDLELQLRTNTNKTKQTKSREKNEQIVV